MKHFKTYIYIAGFLFAGFFSFAFSVSAQLSTQPLHITNIYEFETYPMYQGTAPNGIAGLCVLASFGANQSTVAQVRVAPFSTLQDPVWSYIPATIEIDPPTEGLDMQFANDVDPGLEYIIQFVEVSPNGTLHLITPENLNDDVRFMCTPNQDGTLGSNCPDEAFVVDECSVTGVSEAESSIGSEMIENIVPAETSISFDINTETLTPGQVITLAYTTDLSTITSGSFEGMQTLTFTVPNQSSIPVTLTPLQVNTSYYVTVFNETNSIILTTSNGAGYKSMSTSTPNQEESADEIATSTINVNIDGTFGQAELEGEDINQGFTQCGWGSTYDCDFNQLLATIDRVIKFMLYIVVLPLAAILFAWSGIKLIIAQSKGKQAALSEAKAMFTKVLVGLVFALGAWVIVKFILVILGYSDASGVLSQILGITTTQ